MMINRAIPNSSHAMNGANAADTKIAKVFTRQAYPQIERGVMTGHDAN